jgi:ABC-2 type transport system ATP-binding protein
MVVISGLRKTYPGANRPALDGVDLIVPQGSFFGLVGPNGAGKTSLISILCGLLKPDQGAVTIQSREGAPLAPRAARAIIGLVPQELAFYPTLTVLENLRFFGAMHGRRGAALRSDLERALAIGRLESVSTLRADVLSGGLKRRLNLAIGVIHAPRLLVLDEPTVGVDAQSRNYLQHELKRLNAAGTTIIYTSHYLDEVQLLCDRLAVIDAGRIVAQGALNELLQHDSVSLILEQPATPQFVAQLSALPDVNAVKQDHCVLAVVTANPRLVLARALLLADASQVIVAQATMGARNLETLFFQLTGTRLRDGAATDVTQQAQSVGAPSA